MWKRIAYTFLGCFMCLVAWYVSAFITVILWQAGLLSDETCQFMLSILHLPLWWLGLSEFPPPRW